MKKLLITLITGSILFFGCQENSNVQDKAETTNSVQGNANQSIISLNGTVSEILVALGLESNIIGVDVSSVYPESLKQKTQMGSSHSYNVESIIVAKPKYVIGFKERGLRPDQITQIEQTGIKVINYDQEYSIEGTKGIIVQLADLFQKQAEGKALIDKIDKDLASIKNTTSSKKPKVLFIYARGAKTLQVAGKGTQMNEMIIMAGGQPAFEETFDGFKPLTTEALVSANPDYILLFGSGIESLEGIEGVLNIPGVKETTAGKNKAIIEMEGLKLSGFGPRVGEAVKELHEKIYPAK